MQSALDHLASCDCLNKKKTILWMRLFQIHAKWLPGVCDWSISRAPVVIAQWQITGSSSHVSWVWSQWLFMFLDYFQHEARSLSRILFKKQRGNDLVHFIAWIMSTDLSTITVPPWDSRSQGSDLTVSWQRPHFSLFLTKTDSLSHMAGRLNCHNLVSKE